MKRRVVITGLGAVTSLSCRVDDLFERLCNGESGIRTIQRFDTARFRTHFGGDVLQVLFADIAQLGRQRKFLARV